jgi:hypothetical protein
MAHYCIGNPCWICYPEYAPKSDNQHFDFWNNRIAAFTLPEKNISGVLRELLLAVFRQGLDEDEHFRAMGDELDLEKIKAERAKIDSNSLEAQLLDLMIEDFESKLH